MATFRPSCPQVIEGQYLDQHKLMSLLKNVYGTSEEGKNNFRVDVGHPQISHKLSTDDDPIATTQSIQDLPISTYGYSDRSHGGNLQFSSTGGTND